MYKSLDSFLEEIDQIKQKFVKSGPKFEGSQTVLADTCSQLISKAANHLTITSKHEMNIHTRKLQERLEYVEERASQDKKEFHQQRDSLEKTILELETSRNEAIKTGKLD